MLKPDSRPSDLLIGSEGALAAEAAPGPATSVPMDNTAASLAPSDTASAAASLLSPTVAGAAVPSSSSAISSPGVSPATTAMSSGFQSEAQAMAAGVGSAPTTLKPSVATAQVSDASQEILPLATGTSVFPVSSETSPQLPTLLPSLGYVSGAGDLDAPPPPPVVGRPSIPGSETPGATLLNRIAIENLQEGTPRSEWALRSDIGDANIQGFATEISVNVGNTVDFKIATDSTQYRLEIYRLGYYGGDGARLVDTVEKQLTTAQVQPHPEVDMAMGLIDAGNWSVSASWEISQSRYSSTANFFTADINSVHLRALSSTS